MKRKSNDDWLLVFIGVCAAIAALTYLIPVQP